MNKGIFSSGYGYHENQENVAFAVSMPTVVKGRNCSAYFRKLMWTNIT